jgi:hypothetical protein
MKKKACLADRRNTKKIEGTIYVVRGIGERQEDREREREREKCYEQYYHNQ